MLSRLRVLEPLSLRIAILSLSIGLVVLAVRGLWINYPYHGNFMPAIIAILFIATAYFLIGLSRWARRIMVAILWFLIIIVPLGVINPFFVLDLRAAGTEPPPVEILLALLAPFVIWGIWCLHVLEKHKAKFN